MNHIEFIEHHIMQKLTADGVSVGIAQGGGQAMRLSIIVVARKPAQKGRFSTTACAWLKRGLINMAPRKTSQFAPKRKAALREQHGHHFFKNH